MRMIRIKKSLLKFRGLSIPAKASIVYLVMSVTQKAVSYLTLPIITRLLTTSEYGQVSVYMSWKEVLGIMAMFGLSYGVFNNGMIKFKSNRNDFSFSMLVLSNVFTIVCLVIVIGLRLNSYIVQIMRLDTPLIFLMFLTFFTEPAYLFWMAKNRFEYQYKGIAAYTISMIVIVNVLAVIAAAYFPGRKLYAYLFMREMSYIFFYFIIYIKIGNAVKWKINSNYWKFAVVFNAPLIIHYLSKYILNSSDRIMIANLADSSSAAKYSIAYSASMTVFIVWNAIENTLVPFIYEKVNEEKYHEIGKTIQPISIAFAIMCVVICLFAPEIMKVMATGEYYDSIYIVPIIVGGVYYSSLYSLFSHILYAKNKPVYVMFASVFSAILNLVLNFIFIPAFGYYAAAYTTLFCFWVQAILDYLIMNHILKSRVYSNLFIIFVSCYVMISSACIIILYKFNILRYVFICTLIGIVIIFRKRLIKFINEIVSINRKKVSK